ncbi:hypothetical protein DMENIID0001_168420 [Sergentomyia squamirostris]
MPPRRSGGKIGDVPGTTTDSRNFCSCDSNNVHRTFWHDAAQQLGKLDDGDWIILQTHDSRSESNSHHYLLQLGAKMKEASQSLFAPYVHCYAHQLNLVLLHAAEKSSNSAIQLFFAIVQECFNFLAHSIVRRETPQKSNTKKLKLP